VASEGIILDEVTTCIGVSVDLVSRDDNDGFEIGLAIQRLKQVRGPHDIGLQCGDRFGIAAPHQRLSREMNDDFGACLPHCRGQHFAIGEIGNVC